MSSTVNKRVTSLFKDLSFDISIIGRGTFILSWPYRSSRCFETSIPNFLEERFLDKNLVQARAFVLALLDLPDRKLNISSRGLSAPHTQLKELVGFMAVDFKKHEEKLLAGAHFPEELDVKVKTIFEMATEELTNFIKTKKEEIRQDLNRSIEDSYEFFTHEEIENIVREKLVSHILER